MSKIFRAIFPRAKSCAAIARACDAEIAEMIYDIIPPKKGRAVLVRARIQAPGGEARRGGGLGQMIRTHSLKRERWGEKWAAQRSRKLMAPTSSSLGRPKASRWRSQYREQRLR